jgi:plastocyanin
MRSTLLLASVVALSGSRASVDDSRAPRAAQGTAAVDVRTFQFAPDTIRVRAGDHVVWTNHDEIEHTVTAGTPDARGDAFGKTLAGKGAAYDVTFERPGTFGYFCDRHRFMRGAVIVTR